MDLESGRMIVFSLCVVADCRVGPVQPEDQVRDGEEHGVGDHDEAAQRAQGLEGGRRHLLLPASHVCQPVRVAHAMAGCFRFQICFSLTNGTQHWPRLAASSQVGASAFVQAAVQTGWC